MRTTHVAAVAVVVLAWAGAAVSGEDFRAYEALRTGRQALRAGDTERALGAFGTMLADFPDTPEAAQAAIEAARIYQARGEIEDAQAMYEQARRQGSARWAAEAELGLGALHLKQEAYTKAVARAGGVAEDNSGTPLEGRAWVLRARVRAAEGHPEEAQRLIDQAVERYPSERWAPSALLALVEAWRVRDKVKMELAYHRLRLAYPESLEAMEAKYLMSLPPDHPDARPTVEQIQNLEWLVAFCPDRDLVARAIWALADGQERLSRPRGRHPHEAERVLRRYFQWDWPEFEPWRPKARLRLADLMLKRGQDQAAQAELEALARDYPHSEQVEEAHRRLEAMNPQWVSAAAALRGTGARLEWNGVSEFAALWVSQEFNLYAPGYAARDKAIRQVAIWLQAGQPYAVVWGRRVGIGWGPRVHEGDYLMSREHLAALLKPYGIELADAPTVKPRESPAEALLRRADAMRGDDPHGAFALYEQVVQEYPDTVHAAHARSDLATYRYEKRGHPLLAAALYRRLAALHPKTDWAARARMRVALLDSQAGRMERALKGLDGVEADFAGTPLAAEARFTRARVHSHAREHATAQAICAAIADEFPGLPVAAQALQLAGYSGLWSDASLDHFGYFERLIGDYPDTPEAADAVYYAVWHQREPLRLVRDRIWEPVYDPDPERYLRRLFGGIEGLHPDYGFAYGLGVRRALEAPYPPHAKRFRTDAAVSVARHYHAQRRYATALQVLAAIPEEDLEPDSYYAKEAEQIKTGTAEPDLIALNERCGEIAPMARLEWDGHSEEAVLVAGGVRLHLREGDDFAWAGREIGIGWRAEIEDGDFLVSERGVKDAVGRARRPAWY